MNISSLGPAQRSMTEAAEAALLHTHTHVTTMAYSSTYVNILCWSRAEGERESAQSARPQFLLCGAAASASADMQYVRPHDTSVAASDTRVCLKREREPLPAAHTRRRPHTHTAHSWKKEK